MNKKLLPCLTLAMTLMGCISPSMPPELTQPIFEASSDPSAPPAGHSNHGEAFNKGPRQAAYLMGTTSNVSFPITTHSPDAQAFFNQGIGQLHGFWYLEAERSFRQVLKLHPEHPMAYWGIAMANANNRVRSQTIIKKSVSGRSKVSNREQMWIDSMAAYQKETDSKKRKAAQLKAYQSISDKYPEDLEAQAFLALSMYNNVKTKKNYNEVEKLITTILAKNPMHPCHHYRIHLWDHKDPKRAIVSVGLCGQAAPGIAHMWHMPGHTLSRLKRYHDAAWQMEASARVDHSHQIRDHVMPDQIHNYAHNNEWLTRNLGHAGRVHHAMAMAKNMIELPRLPNVNTNGTWTVSTRSSHAYGRRHLYALLPTYEMWDEIIALKDTHYLRPGKGASGRAKWQRLVASAYFNKNRILDGDKVMKAMEQLMVEQQTDKKFSGDMAETKAKNEGKKATEVRKARTKAERPYNTAISALTRGIAEIKVHRALATGNKPAAKTLLAKATDIRGARRGLLQYRTGDTEIAIKTSQAAVKSGPEQARPLAVHAYLLHATGNMAEAKKAFEHLRRIAPEADLEVPLFASLQSLAKSQGLPADWRTPYPKAKDMGLRPNLDKLGPFQWKPSHAPEWKLRDKNGKPLSMENYRGKPVLMIFYLGKGCSHCMEQLNEFAPATAKFKKLEVDIVAVSTDTTAGLKETFPDFSLNAKQFPFPLVSDARLQVFKAYRAYDDFEETPLHGTFLIDAKGRVRWQDISYEPFTAVEFLLEESKRLLSLPN